MSPVSSVAAAEHAAEWLVFDNLCIGSRGEVGSVILDSSVPIEELEGASIAVTADSATAAQLLRILLARHWKIRAKLIKTDSKATARLLIGDPRSKRPSPGHPDSSTIWGNAGGNIRVGILFSASGAFEKHSLRNTLRRHGNCTGCSRPPAVGDCQNPRKWWLKPQELPD